MIALPAQNMAATLYTGNGTSQSISNAVNGVSFQPDLVWVKNRSTISDHDWVDSVRGATKVIESDLTAAEFTEAGNVTAFNSNGYSVGSVGRVNGNGNSLVGWQWKAGGTAVSNTSGSITSSVSANASAGFSVVTYTGTAGGQKTVGHGLGVAPVFIISKNRTDAATDWYTAAGFLSGWNWSSDYFTLNTTNVKATDGGGTVFPVAPTSTVFTVGDAATNGSGKNYVAYCFAPVAGYSAFGSYTGNGSADGPFVYTGFRPRWVMVKSSSGTAAAWILRDTSMNPSNVASIHLRPNSSAAEDTGTGEYIDILSNGFKLRGNGGNINLSAGTYIYMAFAESPFRNSLAR